jgi:mono/diheme cytochrome c family protein
MCILTASLRVLATVTVVMCCAPPLLAGQETTGASRGAIERGRATYREYCGACHGNRGSGNAPGTDEMKVRPPSLTTLTRRHGAFPAEQIEATLKGTDKTKAHSPAMMAWRAVFLGEAKGDEAAANARVKDVIAFIASIQSK